MEPRNVSFYIGVFANDRVTIFIPHQEYEAHQQGSIYKADLYTTDQALLIKIKDPAGTFIATNVNLRQHIEDKKEVWISSMYADYGFVMHQAKLEFDLIS